MNYEDGNCENDFEMSEDGDSVVQQILGKQKEDSNMTNMIYEGTTGTLNSESGKL